MVMDTMGSDEWDAVAPREGIAGSDGDESCAGTSTEEVRGVRGKEQANAQAQTPTRDQARIEYLRGSIAKIQQQIERTRKELDAVCERLREDDSAHVKDGEAVKSANAVESGSATATSSATADGTPTDRQSATVSNEQVIGKARTTVNAHIKMLTRYNELKDVAMGMFDLIAEHKGVRVADILQEHGVELDD